jgi:D-xylose transport system ATP-binding protein
VIKTAPVNTLTPEQTVSLMVGRDLKSVFPPRTRKMGEVRLEVRGATVRDRRTGSDLVHDVSFSLHRGEILGIAGLVGAGRTELLMSLFGASPGQFTGEILVEGKPAQISSPSDAISHGIALVTEDRRRYGLVVSDTIVRNTTLASLQRFSSAWITNQQAEWQETVRMMKQLRTRATSAAVMAGTLSGGNQQKVVLGKWLLTSPKVLLLDEPTRGIDVGAREEFYRLIADLAEQGMAILVVSSELEEVLGLSDRLLVMYRGRITGEFETATVSQEEIMACAIGQSVRPGVQG